MAAHTPVGGCRRGRRIEGAWLAAAAPWLALLAVGCASAAAPRERGGETKARVDAGAGTFEDDPELGTSPGGETAPAARACDEATRQVYVVSADADLYRFEPDKLKFTKVAALRCPSRGSPTSMAVARDGTAWVRYSDETLQLVDVATGACRASGYTPDPSFRKFGMGFSTDAASGDAETLWLNDTEGSGYAKLDTRSLKLTRVGAPRGQSGELTGTGDGRLFAFLTSNPASLTQIDKVTGALASPRTLASVRTGTHWAFSFWGGDFYFYTADENGFPVNTTSVTKLESATGALRVVLSDIGFRVVGAGVSTCAPTTPPAPR